MIVVADAGPLCYLILIEHAHVLPALYGRVVVPGAVVTELDHERTPVLVRKWLADRPNWLEVQRPQEIAPSLRRGLGPGEREAISLAVELAADLILIDDRDGRREARRLNLAVQGTLRVLADAAEQGLAGLDVVLDRLQRTNFRASDALIQSILDRNARRREA